MSPTCGSATGTEKTLNQRSMGEEPRMTVEALPFPPYPLAANEAA
jgi:hypothetical protein